MRKMLIVATIIIVFLGIFSFSAESKTLFHWAENQVPVAVVQIDRTSNHTEVRLQVQAALKTICWYPSTHTNAPYLLADGRRYRFLGGDNIVICRAVRAYVPGEIMVLRFEPLGFQVHEVSLVEGQGGENQMINPSSSKETFWNFLRINID